MTDTTEQKYETISGDSLISEIIEKHPFLSEYIVDYGIHCVDCMAAGYESLGDGLLGHGMSMEEAQKVIDELNEIIKHHAENKTEQKQ